MKRTWRIGCMVVWLSLVCLPASAETVTLSNGTSQGDEGHMSVEFDETSFSDTGNFAKPGGELVPFIFEYYPVLQFGGDVYSYYMGTWGAGTWTDNNPGDGEISSEGTVGNVHWTVTHSLPQGATTITSRWTLSASQGGALPPIRAFIYFDEDVGEYYDDILLVSGSIADHNIDLWTVDPTRDVGVALGGDANATGWAADQYDDLRGDLNGATFNAPPGGTVDTADLPAFTHPNYGDAYGPGDITVAIEWEFAGGVQSVTFETYLSGLAQGLIAPRGVQASDGTFADKVRVTWEVVRVATSYEVWRGTSAFFPSVAKRIASVAGTAYDDESAEPGRTYYYWVKASNASGTSGFSSSDSGYCVVSAPSAPTGVSASDGTHTTMVRVTWDAAAGATSYEVWRHTSDDSGSATQIASSVTATSYDDTTAVFDTTYYYWVKAVNAGGASGFSSSDSGYRARPTTVCVDDTNATAEDGTEQHPFNTIQEAISVVADGGTIKVAQGTYAWNVTITGKKVTIAGGYEGGTNYAAAAGNFGEANRNADPSANNTVMDGGGAGVVVECQGAAARGSVLTGFQLRNGGATFRGGVVLKRVIGGSN